MFTSSSYAPGYTTPFSERDGADLEPGEEWKRRLREDLEQSFISMIQEARDNHQKQVIEGLISQEQLDVEYKEALQNIKALAHEQYQLALMKERNRRRWIAGVQMLPGWKDILHEEQRNIMRQISNIDNSARVGENITDGRGTNGSAYTTTSSKCDGADLEPDEEWKRKLKEDIEQSFRSMIQEARDHQLVQLKEGTVSRERLDVKYKQTLRNIKALVEEQYLRALMKERNERHWSAGVQMLPGWNDILHEEQQKIMNSIKQTNHSDNPAHAAENPTDERGTNGSLPSSATASAPRHGSESESSDLPPTREAPTRDRTWSRTLSSPSSTDRCRQDNTQSNSSRDREDQVPRSSLSENFSDAALTQDPEEQHPLSSRSSSGRPQPNSEKPWDSLLGRSSTSIPSVSSADRHHFGRSPPKSATPTSSKEELTRREAEFNLLQAQFQKRAEEIKRTCAEERKHQDRGPVIGSESWDRPQMEKKEEQLKDDELSSTSEEESEYDNDDVGVKARELELESQCLERERREADTKIWEQALKLQRLKDEEQGMVEEARKIDEEVGQKEEELRRKEEEDELVEARHASEHLAVEVRKREEETKRKEEAVKKREQDGRRKAEDARKLKSEAAKKVEEIKGKEGEPRFKEAETKKKEEQLEVDEWGNRELKLLAQATQNAREAKRAKETIKKLEEETQKKLLQIQEREVALLLREEELQRREAQAKLKAEEKARKIDEELRRKEEEAKLVEARRTPERFAVEARKREEETKRKEKELKQREEDGRRKAEDACKLKSEAAKEAEEIKRKEAELKLKEAETKKKEEQLEVDELRSQELKLLAQATLIAREVKRAKETVKKLEAETQKKELQIQEREAALLLREEELQRREAEAKLMEEESRREEWRRKKEEARKAAKRREEEARWQEEEAINRRDDEARIVAKRKEDETRPARERNRREQAAQRQQQESERQFHEDKFIAGLELDPTPHTFVRSGYSAFSNSERMRPQADSHDDQQEKIRRQQEKVETEIQLLKLSSREEVMPAWQNWRAEVNHQRPPRSNNSDASQERSRVSQQHPQVSPTKASYAPPASMPMPWILQVPIVPGSPLSQCIPPKFMDTSDRLIFLCRMPKERVINPPSREYLATKSVDNAPDRTNVIPRECVSELHAWFSL